MLICTLKNILNKYPIIMDNKYTTISVYLVIISTAFCATEVPSDICGENVNTTCVRVTSCLHVMKLIDNKDFKTLTKLNCGFEGIYPRVCCPKGEVPISYNENEETATNRPKPLSTLKPGTTSSFAPSAMEQTDKTFPNKTVCGKPSGVGDRIVGGTITQIHEHPWLARIRYRIDDADVFSCSAVLITDRHLLTAAHCIERYKPVSIRLGEWNTETETDCYKNVCNDKALDVNVSKIIKPPTSNISKDADGDIALIQLKETVTFTDFIQPICLPISKYIAMQDYSRDSVYFTAGWGLTEFESESVVKRQVQLKAAPFEVCRRIYNLKAGAERNILCVGGSKGKDTCRGDSGGPLIKLVSKDYETNWYLFGITSLGLSECGAEGVPGLYTRVSAYMDWIRTVVSE